MTLVASNEAVRRGAWLGEDAVTVVVWALLAGYALFLVWGTGFATDDYILLQDGLIKPLSDNWYPKVYLSLPVLHYTHGIVYFLVGDRPWVYDLLKALYLNVDILFVSRFLARFCPRRRALVLAFLFVFFPLHDSASYSFTVLYLINSIAAYLFAYTLAAEGRLRWAFLVAFLASFSCYGTPPIALGVCLLALLERKPWAIAPLLIPNLLYIVYYLVTSLYFHAGIQRLTGQMTVAAIARQYALQIATFLDAAVGPSAWAKFFYSVGSLHVAGLVAAVVATAVVLVYIRPEKRRAADRRLLVGAGVILLGSFGIFALTGLYPQMAFSLGDRVMVYGSFFLICCLASLPVAFAVEAAVVLLLLLATTGISTHWKDWRIDTDRLAANIRDNRALHALPPGTLLYISGHQYSRLGPFCHIDFFTASYVIRGFFALRFGDGPALRLESFNRRLAFENGQLVDRKYGNAVAVGDGIWLYDSDRNVLEYVKAADIAQKLTTLPDETRHWTQMLPDGWLRRELLRLVPRLKFAYE